MNNKTYYPIEKLKEWDKNPRTITKENFEKLKKQIQELGEYKPLIITEDGTVLGGNMRLKAYRELGFKQCWVSIVDAKTEEEKLKYALSDNDQLGEYNKDELVNLISSVDIDLSNFTINLDKSIGLDELLDRYKEVEEDDVPEVEEGEPKSKRGEIYKLGRHRLMCGDATSKEDVENLLNEIKPDLVITDPPYNINFGYKEYKDKKNEDEYYFFCNKWFSIFSKYNLIFTPGPRNIHLYPKPTDIGIWIKRGGKTGATLFNLRFCEPIFFYGSFSKKRPTDLFEYNTGDYKELTLYELQSNLNIKKRKREYAPAKPVKLIIDLIKNFSDEESIILDCFGGNGTTLIACEQTNRICYMMEIDSHYCDVIRKRYVNFVYKSLDNWESLTHPI